MAPVSTSPRHNSVLAMRPISSYTFVDFLQICKNNVKNILRSGPVCFQAVSARRNLESSGREVYGIRH
jgi:hypothetical protein